MVELLFPRTLSEDMRDVFYMDSLGRDKGPFSPWFNVTNSKWSVTFVYLFIIHGFPYHVKPFQKKKTKLNFVTKYPV